MSDRSPRNTAADDPITKLLVAASSEGIYAQERQGQAEVLASETLPTEILHSTQADFEALGFVFGDKVDGDPLFRKVTLPDGWSRKGTSHSMWSSLVDERGVERVAVFYKAAFYDRKAHMGLSNVGYSTATEYIYGDGAEPFVLDARLNAVEIAALRESASRYVADAERHPDIYGDRLPRAQAILRALDAR